MAVGYWTSMRLGRGGIVIMYSEALAVLEGQKEIGEPCEPCEPPLVSVLPDNTPGEKGAETRSG
jgi:hypothetical protein